MTAASVVLTAAVVAEATGGRVVAGDPGQPLGRVAIDSRTMAPGDVFFSIVGPRFDGHAFVADAVRAGASGVVVADPSSVGGAACPVVVVPDTTRALQDLARFVRRASGARVVAITGSVGKTTTKEATAALLEARFRTHRNRGNLNNHIGLPLSLIELRDGADVSVVELGMNHAGEIRQLVGIAEPDVRVWLNVGAAHLEFFGTMDRIADAKAEILEGARASDVLVANADDPRVMSRSPRFAGRVVTFGLERPADVTAIAIDDRGFAGLRATARTPRGLVRVDLRLPGLGHLANVLAAIAVAEQFDVAPEAMADRIARLEPPPHRGQVLSLAGGVTLVDDSYNSSPTALARAIDTVRRGAGARRVVAFLGEMLELGPQSEALHREGGRLGARHGLALVVSVGGPAAAALGEGAVEAGLDRAKVCHVDTSEEAARLASTLVRDGDVVLVKGSRGTQMERVVERLQAERG